MKIKLSKSQWEGIGKKAGWLSSDEIIEEQVIDMLKKVDEDLITSDFYQLLKQRYREEYIQYWEVDSGNIKDRSAYQGEIPDASFCRFLLDDPNMVSEVIDLYKIEFKDSVRETTRGRSDQDESDLAWRRSR